MHHTLVNVALYILFLTVRLGLVTLISLLLFQSSHKTPDLGEHLNDGESRYSVPANLFSWLGNCGLSLIGCKNLRGKFNLKER
jgi:hypothetical protein